MPSPQRKSSGHSKIGRKQRKRANDRMLFARAAAAQAASFNGNDSMSDNNQSDNTNHPPSFTAEQQAAIAKLSLSGNNQSDNNDYPPSFTRVSSPSDAEVTSMTNSVVSAAIDALRWDGTLLTAANSRSTSPNSLPPPPPLYAPPPQQLQQRPRNKKQESMTTMIDNVVQGEQRLAKLKEDLEILHRHQMLLETMGTSSNSRVAMMMKPQHHQLHQQDQPCYNLPLALPSLNASSFNAYPTHANAAPIPAIVTPPASQPISSLLLNVLTERFLERSVSRHNTHRHYRSSPNSAAATSA